MEKAGLKAKRRPRREAAMILIVVIWKGCQSSSEVVKGRNVRDVHLRNRDNMLTVYEYCRRLCSGMQVVTEARTSDATYTRP